MSATVTQFHIPHNLALSAVEKRLANSGLLTPEHRLTVRRTFFDSFDWLLYRAGRVLEQECHGGECRLRLRPWCSDQGVHTLLQQQPPGLAADLPGGVFHRQLAAIIKLRRVLPLFSLRSRRHLYTLRDGEDKIRLWLWLEQNTLLREQGNNRSLGKRLCLQPLRGYSGELGQVISYVSDDLGLTLVTGDVLDKGLAVLGRQAGDYQLKQIVSLSAHMPADQACRRILQPLFDTMRRNEEGIRNNTDSEFLHDYRVAVRSTRTIFTQCRKLFDAEMAQTFIDELRWLGEVTGPLRDADVYLLEIPVFAQQLPDKLASGLDMFRHYLQQQHQRQHDSVCQMLDSGRYRQFCHNWQQFLDRDEVAADMPDILTHANTRIRKMYHRAVKEGNAIDDDSPDTELHELRKTCKKLRYLLEYMQPLYNKQDVRNSIHMLKQLQNNLGEFQDLSVQIATLAHFNDSLVDTRQNHKTKKALARLVQHMQRHKQQVRKNFHKVFAGFDTNKTHRLFDKLLAEPSDSA